MKSKLAKIVIILTSISAAVMELIDSSIVNVALNQIAGNLGSSIEDVSWVIISYAIANVIIIPMTGFLSQYFGRKRYYMASIIIFTVSSIFCGLSTSIWQLVFWRFIQGLGGGGLLSTSQSILFDAFPLKQRRLAGALYGMGIVMGPTLGPTLGGLIIDNYNWPLIFYINIPFGIFACFLSYRYVTNENEVSVKPDIDWLGIILLTIGIGSLQYVLERGETEDWYDSIYIRWFTCTALAGIISFIWWELRQKHPVVNLHIMKSRSLSLTTILTFVSGFALYTSVYVFPLLLQRVLGYTAFETGIAILPTSLLFIIVMPILGRILQSGAKPTMFVFFGFVALILFGILMFRTDINVSSSFFALPLMARAMGLALLMAPLTSMAVQGLKPVDIPQGIALNNMMRQLGGSLGIAMINNYINQRYAIHRMDLITNIYDGSNQLVERTSLLMQGLQSKLSVSANIQQQAYSALNLSVMKQSYLLTYLDAFLFSSVCILVVLPLIFMARNKSIPQ